MKKSILALFIACSTFLFTACDDPKPQASAAEEVKAAEPAKEMPAQPNAEATLPAAQATTEEPVSTTTETALPQKTPMSEAEPKETVTAPAATEETTPPTDTTAQPKDTAVAPVTAKPMNKQAAHKQELARVLSMLEKQYTQVRCVNDIKDDSGKIKMDSYCRQEEERLIREMQRVKRELAK